MYDQISRLPMDAQIETIARSLVGIKSVNGTRGEAQIADHIEGILRSYPYFRQHPSAVWTQELKNDALGRKNVFAFLKDPAGSSKTVIYHAHTDTVGIEDYGPWKEYACDPDALQAFFSKYEKRPDVQTDAQSGDWLFGRGALDMKSGAAVHLANLLHYSENPEELVGNLLVMFNPVEENQHTGVIEAISELKRLQTEHGLEYVIGINDDFISPLYEGDRTRYIYTGAVGKLLPCFYITGREAHVGQTLTGIDPTLIASEINCRVNNNMALAETLPGEVVLPPSCLFLRDQKDFYNVQTATKAYLYFNYFLYRASSKDVMETLLGIAREACADVEQRLSANYRMYAEASGLPADHLSWQVRVTTYQDFVEELAAKGIDTETIARQVTEANPGMEPRMLCFKIVEALEHHDLERAERVVVFFAPPYCPHNYLKEDDERQQRLRTALEMVLACAEREYGETFAVKNFFPYLSDSSYLSLHESPEEVDALIRNFPEWETIYPVPVHDIRALNIPSVNIGVYGKDAHQWTERIYKPYSYGVLPGLIRQVTGAMWSL